MPRLPFALAIGFLVIVGDLEASPVSRQSAERAASAFCRAIVTRPGFSYSDFTGKTRRAISPFLSHRLLRVLDSIHQCGLDWERQQPPDSTDKPPYVDCCVFSDSADWSPTGYAVKDSQSLPDGRWRVTVEYRYDSKDEHARWHIALYMTKENGRVVVDDFEGGLDEPDTRSWFVSKGDPECVDGRWAVPK